MQTLEKQAGTDRFVRGVDAGMLGAVGLVAAGISYEIQGNFLGWMMPLGAIALALVAYGLGTTIRDRRSDEYTLALWHAGAGFAVTLFFLIAVFLPAVLVGLGAPSATDHWGLGNLPLRWEAVLVCLSFFAAIRWRMRGGGR
jgi:hypothetical protein